MFASFRLRSSKTKEAPTAREEPNDIKSPSKRKILRIKSWHAFSKRLLLGKSREEPGGNQKSPKALKRQRPEKSKPNSPEGQTIAIRSELEIPEFVMCNVVEDEESDGSSDDDDDESESFDENADYDFDECTFMSYRSILDDLSMEFYEDPYLDKSLASFRPEDCDDDDEDEIDIHTPLPSHVNHAACTSHFKEMRDEEIFVLDLESNEEPNEEHMSLQNLEPAISAVNDPQDPNSEASQDIHVVFPTETLDSDTALDLTSGFTVSHSSNLHSITEVVDEIENIVNPFANDPSHYFSPAAKAAALRRVSLESALVRDEITSTTASSSSLSDVHPVHNKEVTPLSQRAKMEALRSIHLSPTKCQASLHAPLLHTRSGPQSPTKAQLFFL